MTAKARLIQKTGTMDLGLVKAAAGQVNFNYLFNESLQKLLRIHSEENRHRMLQTRCCGSRSREKQQK